MSRLGTLGNNLYRGQVSYDFVGKRRTWFITSGVVLLIAVGSLIFQGLNFGVEFTGGTVFQVQTTGSVADARDAVTKAGVADPVVQQINGNRIRIETESLSTVERAKVQAQLSTTFKVPASTIDVQFVGPSWGKEITKKAVTGLIVFLIFVSIFLAVYFEWKMAVAALIALIHDVFITIGIYSLLQIEVTPATVIGVLTILGYSLYDTVVVFDKVRENTAGLAGGSRMTYSQAANLAVNQTLVRSLNTTIVALLPVAAILFGGAILLGAGTLKDLALALFVGIAAGAYSSIFIATPLVATFKEREPEMQALARRVAARQSAAKKPAKAGKAAKTASAGGAVAVAESDADEAADDDAGEVAPAASTPPRSTGPRNQPQRKKKRPGGKKR